MSALISDAPELTTTMPMIVPKDLPILEASAKAQGDHLRRIRTTLGLSRNQFCDELDVTNNTLSLWENGSRPIGNLRMVLYACAYLAVRKNMSTAIVFVAEGDEDTVNGRRLVG